MHYKGNPKSPGYSRKNIADLSRFLKKFDITNSFTFKANQRLYYRRKVLSLLVDKAIVNKKSLQNLVLDLSENTEILRKEYPVLSSNFTNLKMLSLNLRSVAFTDSETY